MKVKVFDCFTFFNEYDLLEVRLAYLYPYVDHFVIVESDTTHGGDKKPFNYELHKERYKQYEDKITYVRSEMPGFEISPRGAWQREGYQRDEIRKGLIKLKASDEDIVLLSDLDEIINAELITQLKFDGLKTGHKNSLELILETVKSCFGLARDIVEGRNEFRLRLKQSLYELMHRKSMPVMFRMDNFYYFINNREKRRNIWRGTVSFEFGLLHKFSLNDLRELRRFPLRTIEGAGWHFSYLGGIELIKHKLKSFAHQEFNIEEVVNDEYIKFCIENGHSLFTYYNDKTTPPQFEKVGLEVFPEELRMIMEKFPHLAYS